MTCDNISALFEGGITRAINVTVTATLAPPTPKKIFLLTNKTKFVVGIFTDVV
jgi:hypothetical protein